jgi:hypothetical protein
VSWCPLGAIASVPALAGRRMCEKHCCGVLDVLSVPGGSVAGSAAQDAV